MVLKLNREISLIVLTDCITMVRTALKIMDMINVHSWNVGGLEMNNRKYIVRRCSNKLIQKDFICLQEN